VIWNLTARSPLRLARDIASALHRPQALLRGVVHFVLGLVLLTGGGLLVMPLVGSARDFVALEMIALIAALVVDQLVGPDLRRVYRAEESP
jgi:hypothetical protein